jgi:hypothetical protein
MAERVFRMTTGHLVRWTITYGIAVGLWTWLVLTDTSAVSRIIGVVLGLLTLRGLAGSLVAFVRRPKLTLAPEALTVTGTVGARVVAWADCSEFSPARTMTGTHVRYQVGERRRSLPAGFRDADRRLTANELAHALNRARDASSRLSGPATST